MNGFPGRCECGSLTYLLSPSPLFVHACHCTDCQRAAGSVFRMTTIILEADFAVLTGTLSLEGTVDRKRYECADCGDVMYRTATNHPATALLRTSTLDDLRQLKIGAHIWTQDKHPWIVLPEDVPQFDRGYDRQDLARGESAEATRRIGEVCVKDRYGALGS